jgi:NAD(P)-dependent dehydrogenase (short-subunit alcohol dehydrogenase family)
MAPRRKVRPAGIPSDPTAIEQHLAVNLFGTYAMTQAFVPALARSRGAIVNVLSVNALAAMPLMPAYSLSKAAALSLTQSLRVLLAAQGVRVHAVLPGPVDTDMLRGVDIPEASPAAVAAAVLDAVNNDEDDIFPDPMSALLADSWRDGAAMAVTMVTPRWARQTPSGSPGPRVPSGSRTRDTWLFTIVQPRYAGRLPGAGRGGSAWRR